jgi:hypothetical protein
VIPCSAKAFNFAGADSLGGSIPTLRSGLYIIHSPTQADSEEPIEQMYVVYWPEDTTWDDSAINAVRRNRVTFMR